MVKRPPAQIRLSWNVRLFLAFPNESASGYRCQADMAKRTAPLWIRCGEPSMKFSRAVRAPFQALMTLSNGSELLSIGTEIAKRVLSICWCCFSSTLSAILTHARALVPPCELSPRDVLLGSCQKRVMRQIGTVAQPCNLRLAFLDELNQNGGGLGPIPHARQHAREKHYGDGRSFLSRTSAVAGDRLCRRRATASLPQRPPH